MKIIILQDAISNAREQAFVSLEGVCPNQP
jgi:hypothetical protein